MFEIWVPITLTATVFQNIRTSLQKYLKGRLSTAGATYVRFFYAIPFALLYVFLLNDIGEYELPELHQRFLFFAMLGGIAQIGGTGLLIYLFSFRNFVVGTAYSKTETVQTAIFGVFILSGPITLWAFVAIATSLLGVMLLAIAHQNLGVKQLFASLINKTAQIGMASGACFAVAAISYRAASLSINTSGFVMSAACTLAFVVLFQTVTMTIYLYLKEPGQLAAVFKAWKVAGIVGLTGMLASVGWFTAKTIQNAAHVRALGQVELLLAFMTSLIIFREKVNKVEIAGIVLLILGIWVLLMNV